jgi:lipopolysaccharide export system permease protein
MRLTRYLSLRFIAFTLAATAILAAVAQILDLVDKAADILDRGDGAAGLLEYVSLRSPTLLMQALPLGALVGGLASFGALARSSEIVAMRAAGLSGWNLFVKALPGALALATVHCAMLDLVAPKLETSLALWWAQGLEGKIHDDARPTWMRIDGAVISFDRMSDRGRKLSGVRIFARNDDKVATGRTNAAEATFADGAWTLKGATHTSWLRETFNQQTAVDGRWDTRLTPADVIAALTPKGLVSASVAQSVLAGERISNAPKEFYETLIYRVYAAPTGLMVMLLLAMPAAFINWRDSRSAGYALAGLAVGLIFLVTDGLFATLGQSGMLPAGIASWTPVAAFAILGALILQRLDGGVARPGRRVILATRARERRAS